jgi:hypothetical protein
MTFSLSKLPIDTVTIKFIRVSTKVANSHGRDGLYTSRLRVHMLAIKCKDGEIYTTELSVARSGNAVEL